MLLTYKGKSNSTSAVESMLRAISYRGPDESGIYHSQIATFGNVRLSIIDLQTGQQPLSDITGRYWIVFNGEIFNYIELRADLEKKGVLLKTHSDTEVLVNLYALYKEKCLNLLNGQFAFAVWDKKEEELFIARDRVGIRPLFYTLANGVFYFASEIKALFRQKEITRELIPRKPCTDLHFLDYNYSWYTFQEYFRTFSRSLHDLQQERHQNREILGAGLQNEICVTLTF